MRTNTKEWMDRPPYQVEKKDNVEFETWEITPERAKQILSTMAQNRNLKPTRVSRYASDMARGLWQMSPQPIVFDENHQLVDGQHRLSAVIKSGKTICFHVALNVPTETPLDVGLPRSTGDSLRCRGLISQAMGRNSSVAIANLFFRLKFGSSEKFRSITDEDKAAFLNKHEDNILLAQSIANKGTSRPVCKKAGVQLAILFALLNGVSPDVLYRFTECANTGFYDNDRQKAAIAFRNTIMETKMPNGHTDQLVVESAAEQAISDFLRGTPRQRRYVATDKFPLSGNFSAEEVME